MKKSFILFATSILALAGCTRNQEIDIQENGLTLFAKTESPADTKTVVESGIHVYWEPGDEIAVFMGEKSAKFTTDITAASGTATFKGTFGDQGWPEELDLWAVYPYSEDATFDGETITTTLPSEQIAREGSFGKDMNLSIAHSNSSTLQFYNVGGGIRFSVTEEGIKKVIFEGLSGEIISGKVKIGLDDGLPVVKEVTGGSQFITLLPPSGKETFEKDTWYYIVAIPGSLDAGYKLRFYKDSDYARKVSEKAVTIKRSIYGNIEKADMGIEYEAQVTHFPKTEEEKVASINRIETIAERTQDVIDQAITNNTISDEATLINELSSIEGVISCTLSETKDVAFLMLRDSVYVNVQLFNDNSKWGEGGYSPNISKLSSRAKLVNKTTASKKALILSPYQSEDKDKGFDAVMTSYIEEILSPLGFQVDPLIDKQVTIDHFRGDSLKQYDIVWIASHGNYGLTVNGKPCCGIATNDRVSIGNWLSRLFNKNSDISFAIAKGVVTYVATASWMEKTTSDLSPTSYKNNSMVILQSCYSYYNDEFYDYFIDHGVSTFGGFIHKADKQVSQRLLTDLFCYLSDGVDFKTAAEYVKTKDPYVLAVYEFKIAEEGDSPDISPESFNFTPRPDYFITDAHPKDLKHSINSAGDHVFTWEMNPSWGSFLFDIIVDGIIVGQDLAISDSFDFPDSSNPLERQLSFSYVPSSFSSSNKKHSWSVIAKVYAEGVYFASYQTNGDDFTTEEEPSAPVPDAIDLGLPSGLKWASFNLGATKPDEFGDYYAWGEIEPKNEYEWSNYKWCDGSYTKLTKYNTSEGYGYVDNKIQLDPEDDIARVLLGDKWRMPTAAEIDELIEKCTWTWDSKNGVNGYWVANKADANARIFIPAAGYPDGTGIGLGYYWSSVINPDYPNYANLLFISDNDIDTHGAYRSFGFTIRPVYGDRKTTPSGDIEGTEEDPWN